VSMLIILLLAVLTFVARHRNHCDPATWGAFGLALSSAMFSGDLFDSRGVFLLAVLGSQEVVAVARQRSPSPRRGLGIVSLQQRPYSPTLSTRA
jgi:hypothetical protein